MSARTSDGSMGCGLEHDNDPNLRDGETLEERQWRDAQPEPEPKGKHEPCPLCAGRWIDIEGAPV